MDNKLTIVGDPHCKQDNMDKIRQLFHDVEQLGNPVVWLSDMLDSKEIIRGKCLNLLYDLFKQSKLQHYLLVGNHDYFNNDCVDHSLRVLGQLPNVTINENNPHLWPEEFAAINYCGNPDIFKEEVEHARDTGRKILFIHQGINGFDFGNGFIEENGVDPEIFKPFDLVIAGHFHRYQTRDNLIYLGSPFSHNFGETNQVKYIGVLDMGTQELELKVTKFPRHMTYDIDADKEIIPDDLIDIGDFNQENHNRVIITGKKENVNRVSSRVQEVLPWVKIICRPTDEVYDGIIDESQTNIAKFVTWATEIKRLDPATVDLGKEILETHDA